MQAAVGCAQLKKLEGFIKARKNNFAYLSKALKKYEKYLLLPRATINSDPSWFGFPILVKRNNKFGRDEIVNHLESSKVATRMLFGGNLIKQPAYENIKYRIVDNLENTDSVMNNLFWIGIYPGITSKKLAYIKSVFDDFMSKF